MTNQWQVTWRDLKSRTSQKARKIRNERNATGNKEIVEIPLTSLELRVIGIIGKNYVEGSSDCPDSVPEEEDLQEQLAAGDSSALLIPPRVINIFGNVPSTFTCADVRDSEVANNREENENSKIDHIDCEYIEYNNPDENISEGKMQIESIEDNEEQYGQTETSNVVKDKSAVVNAKSRKCAKDLKRKAPYTTNSALASGPRKRKQSKQLSSVRDQFAAIAEAHAQSMMMLAEASKLQAESTKRHADAMGRFAESMEKQADAALQNATNEKARIEVMSRLVEVLSQLLPTYP